MNFVDPLQILTTIYLNKNLKMSRVLYVMIIFCSYTKL